MDWRFYDPATGLFHRRQINCPASQVQANTPPGHVAMAGTYDWLSQRVDITAQPDADGNLPVIDYQPPAPADTDMHTWAWDATARRWVSSPTLAALKAARWLYIRTQRDAAEFGGFAWDGSMFDSDSASQARIMGAVQMATLAAAQQQPFEIDWTLADNTVRTLDGADMVAVGLALGAHVAATHAAGRALRADINAATTAEQVAAVVW